jgi:hypothetical protein
MPRILWNLARDIRRDNDHIIPILQSYNAKNPGVKSTDVSEEQVTSISDINKHAKQETVHETDPVRSLTPCIHLLSLRTRDQQQKRMTYTR